jgi:hypothetical protein
MHAAVGFRSTLDWSQAHLTEAARRGVIILNAVVVAELALRFSGIEGIHAAIPSMAIVDEIPFAASSLAGHAHAPYRQAGSVSPPTRSRRRARRQ